MEAMTNARDAVVQSALVWRRSRDGDPGTKSKADQKLIDAVDDLERLCCAERIPADKASRPYMPITTKEQK